MNYIYKVEKKFVIETDMIETNNWTLDYLRCFTGEDNSLMTNNKQINSFRRTQKWVLENYPELLL
jgi:hypothetical protein